MRLGAPSCPWSGPDVCRRMGCFTCFVGFSCVDRILYLAWCVRVCSLAGRGGYDVRRRQFFFLLVLLSFIMCIRHGGLRAAVEHVEGIWWAMAMFTMTWGLLSHSLPNTWRRGFVASLPPVACWPW